MNVGTFEGEQGVNMVPDVATVGVDISTVAGMDHAVLLCRLKDIPGKEVELDVFSDMNAVWTQPPQAWVQRVFEVSGKHLDEHASMERIRQSVAIYEDLIRDWCRV